MVDASSKRRIVLLIAAPSLDRVLARGSDLPTFECTLNSGETTIEAVARALPSMGLRGPILDCVVDQASEDDLGEEPRSAFVEIGSPSPDWVMPADLAWLAWNKLDVTLPSGLEAVGATRIAELTGVSVVPKNRAAWTRPGWFGLVAAWIERSLESAGRMPAETMVQVRHWGISALIRVDAADGRTWFKASFPLFRNEAPISALLTEIAPGMTGNIVAVDADQGWLLLDDFDGTTDAIDPETTRQAVGHLVQLQHDMISHRSALRAAGCPHRGLSNIAGELRTALGREVALGHLNLARPQISELVDSVTEAAAAVEVVALPETLVHGDFHPGNIAVASDGLVLFDWSDAAIGNPVVDMATWAWWYEDDEPASAMVWAEFCSAWQREFGVDSSLLRREDVDVVAGAFHLVSYVGILEALEPTDRPSHAGGLEYFFALLNGGIAQRSAR